MYGLRGSRTTAGGSRSRSWTGRAPTGASGSHDLARPSLPVRFTFGTGDDATPVWSPDDAQIAYLSRRNPKDPGKPLEWSIDVKSSRGEGTARSLLSAPATSYLTSWSLDGALLAFNRPSPATRNDVYLLSLRDQTARRAIGSPAEDRDAVFSPDGRWIAYMSGESGRFEVYVRAFPGPGGQWQISTSGGYQPRWRPDGKALFYATLDGQMMTVPLRTAPAFEADAPQVLFTYAPRRTLIAQYDVFPDGKRLLVNSLAESDVAGAIHLVENWPAIAAK